MDEEESLKSELEVKTVKAEIFKVSIKSSLNQKFFRRFLSYWCVFCGSVV